MSHGITGDSFWQLGERGPAWHHIQGGIFVPGEMPSVALRKMGEHEVERAPLAAWSEAGQEWVPITSDFALLRGPIASDPSRKSLGVVTADYTVVQHAELAGSLDALVHAGWQLETAAILHDGGQLFMTFNADGYVVNGDDIENYWAASVRHAHTALNIVNTPVRMVCANTFNLGMQRATERISIPHFRTAHEELGWAVDVLAQAHARDEQVQEELTALGQTPMDVDSYTSVLDAAYPLPRPIRRMQAIQQRVTDLGGSFEALEVDTLAEYTRLQESHEAKLALQQRLRDAVGERVVSFNDSRPQYADTAWSVWNSISEIESHRRGKSVGTQVLFGERGEVMARGYKQLLKVAAAR